MTYPGASLSTILPVAIFPLLRYSKEFRKSGPAFSQSLLGKHCHDPGKESRTRQGGLDVVEKLVGPRAAQSEKPGCQRAWDETVTCSVKRIVQERVD